MSLTVSAYQEHMPSVPESSSVICADLPVRQEPLDSAQMAQAEGELWGWVAVGAGLAIGGAIAGWLISEAIEDAVPEIPIPEIPNCPDPHITISYDFDDNELTAEIDCGNEDGDGG